MDDYAGPGVPTFGPPIHTVEPHWAEDWSRIIVPEGWVYLRDEDHDDGTCAIYRHSDGTTIHVELPD